MNMNIETKTQKKIICISGGTVTHIRPHLSLCAPAYGSVASKFHEEFLQHNLKKPLGFEYITTLTKMADSESDIETNEDMTNYIDTLLLDMSVKCIIMSAAICDYEALCISDGENQTSDYDIGKQYARIKTKDSNTLSLDICPTTKIVKRIKQLRPDIILVSFKATSNDTYLNLVKACVANLNDNNSDFVFGNDIKNKYNIVLSDNGDVMELSRDHAIDYLVAVLVKKVKAIGITNE